MASRRAKRATLSALILRRLGAVPFGALCGPANHETIERLADQIRTAKRI